MKKLLFAAITSFSSITLISAQDAPADQQAITNVVNTMQNGWNNKSGEEFASVFADMHDFIVWNGYYFRNTTKNATATSHQGLFNGPFKMTDIRLKVDKIKFIRPDIALAHVVGASFDKGKGVPKDPGILMSLLMEKKGDKWQIMSLHNLDLEAFEKKEIADRSPMPLHTMYASWYQD